MLLVCWSFSLRVQEIEHRVVFVLVKLVTLKPVVFDVLQTMGDVLHLVQLLLQRVYFLAHLGPSPLKRVRGHLLRS